MALAFAAWGLAVMWPRFLTVTLFAVMLFLYYLLARDEERRMSNRFGESFAHVAGGHQHMAGMAMGQHNPSMQQQRDDEAVGDFPGAVWETVFDMG